MVCRGYRIQVTQRYIFKESGRQLRRLATDREGPAEGRREVSGEPAIPGVKFGLGKEGWLRGNGRDERFLMCANRAAILGNSYHPARD
jgi:hypothetical protein